MGAGRHRRFGGRGGGDPAPRQAAAADQLAVLAVARHAAALAERRPPVPARHAGRRSRQSRWAHRRGYPRLDRTRRRVRAEHPAMRAAAGHLSQRAVGPVGHDADQVVRPGVQPAGLHGVGRRGLCPRRLAAHLFPGAWPDPCRQHPPESRGRFPVRADASARACRRHCPDARRKRRARASAQLAVRPADGLERPDARPGQSLPAHQLARLSCADRAVDRCPATLPWRRDRAGRPDANGTGLLQRAVGVVLADRQFPEVRRMARFDRSCRASPCGADRSRGKQRGARRRANRGPSRRRVGPPGHA